MVSWKYFNNKCALILTWKWSFFASFLRVMKFSHIFSESVIRFWNRMTSYRLWKISMWKVKDLWKTISDNLYFNEWVNSQKVSMRIYKTVMKLGKALIHIINQAYDTNSATQNWNKRLCFGFFLLFFSDSILKHAHEITVSIKNCCHF